jgi:hypothetical protein
MDCEAVKGSTEIWDNNPVALQLPKDRNDLLAGLSPKNDAISLITGFKPRGRIGKGILTSIEFTGSTTYFS